MRHFAFRIFILCLIATLVATDPQRIFPEFPKEPPYLPTIQAEYNPKYIERYFLLEHPIDLDKLPTWIAQRKAKKRDNTDDPEWRVFITVHAIAASCLNNDFASERTLDALMKFFVIPVVIATIVSGWLLLFGPRFSLAAILALTALVALACVFALTFV